MNNKFPLNLQNKIMIKIHQLYIKCVHFLLDMVTSYLQLSGYLNLLTLTWGNNTYYPDKTIEVNEI